MGNTRGRRFLRRLRILALLGLGKEKWESAHGLEANGEGGVGKRVGWDVVAAMGVGKGKESLKQE